MKNTISNEYITFRVPNTVKDKIEHYAEMDWVSISEICRRGIKHQLQKLSTNMIARMLPLNGAYKCCVFTNIKIHIRKLELAVVISQYKLDMVLANCST